jgi:Bacterial transglutaminase-like cysteine proteinase BTLCP
VLLKRRLLMSAAWPREALLITVVSNNKDEGHAVLTVKTDRGEFILDNQVEDVLRWSDTGYRFVKRQSEDNPNIWVSLGDPRMAPPTVAARAPIGPARIEKPNTAQKDNSATRTDYVPTPIGSQIGLRAPKRLSISTSISSPP